MPASPIRLASSVDALRSAFDDIRAELGITATFDDAVMAEAEEAARRGPALPPDSDRRDLPLVSIDPRGSRDLDQAVCIERSRNGYVVWYAIADVAAFVKPGGAIDAAARARGVTVYLPDGRAPLHPPLLSEGAASLLPGEDRQALLWRFELDGDAQVQAVDLERATVRNRRAWSYDEAQQVLDSGVADVDGTIQLLAEVGPSREALEVERGGLDLGTPEQLVTQADGRYRLEYRAPLAVEGWNAQISLMTGMAAASMMIGCGIGVLRTLPKPPEEEVEILRRHARGLGISWPAAVDHATFIRDLDPTVDAHAALLAQAGRLFRGAAYISFDVDRGIPLPDDAAHAAVAAPYAHVTAPLRRLVDRFGNEIALAAARGAPPAAWARDALDELPAAMAEGRRREGAADGLAADLVEAAVLSGCLGRELDAVVVRTSRHGVQVQVRDPAVVATVTGTDAGLGDNVRVRVEEADPTRRHVKLTIVP